MNKQYFTKSYNLLLVVFIIFFAQFANQFSYSATSQNKKIYKFGAHIESNAGFGSSELLDIANRLTSSIKEKTGISIIIDNKFSTYGEVLNAFINREIDAMSIGNVDVIKLKAKGINILPLFAYTFGKRDKIAMCLWQQKRKSYNSTDIIGTRLLNNNTFWIYGVISLRDYLFKIGIDKPLWKVFKSFIKVPSPNSALLALAMGKGDFYWDRDDWEYGLKLLNPGLLAKISRNFCTERTFDREILVLNKQAISEKDYKQLIAASEKILPNFEEILKNDPKLKSFLPIIKQTKLELVVAKGIPFEEEIRIWEKAKQNGWYEEAQYLCDTVNKADFGQEVNVKPDYKYCNWWCYEKSKLKAEKLKSCMDECME